MVMVAARLPVLAVLLGFVCSAAAEDEAEAKKRLEFMRRCGAWSPSPRN
jgi:hypothetical protein